ncbi:hypothetical protein CPT_Musica_051 [Burkholderia phage Musica]|uniref:Uncharacterized protein n=1 Tax=Burkholderia phage Musica TaxID=2924903 RepID=A0AAE9G849_9CAUD|nr:hypothetical protein CPT_Musica_051 [Burkholderia phage Musica]
MPIISWSVLFFLNSSHWHSLVCERSSSTSAMSRSRFISDDVLSVAVVYYEHRAAIVSRRSM